MNNIQEYNETESKKNTCLEIPKSLKSEFHFLKFPFFDLCPRKSKKDKIEIKETEETEEGKIDILWKVSRNVDFDFPSSFARRLHKEVVERILNNIKRPIPRLIRLGSLNQMCKIMNIAVSGRNKSEIKRVLQDIKATTIQAKGTFRTKEKGGIKKFFEGNFNLYDTVFFTGETLPNATEADAVYILLNDMYIQNFNNNLVVPLDYDYFQSLQGDIASRMYEVLSVWFYPALEYNKKYIDKNYSELCNYFPLTSQNKKWRAKGQLKKAHQQHVSNCFLAKEPEWLDRGKKDDWIIRYYIGQRAKEWYKQNKKYQNGATKQIEELIQENKQRILAKPSQKQKQPIFEDPLVIKLSEIGITKEVAIELVEKNDKEAIIHWIKAVKNKSVDDKPAFLVSAINEGWELPEKYRKKKQKSEKEKAHTVYSQFITEQIDRYLKKMTKQELEQELKKHEEKFFKKAPFFESFKGSNSVKPYIEADYRKEKKIELGLPSFEEWVKTTFDLNQL